LVYVDRNKWEQTILNLISIAFKFTLEGEIEITLRDAGDGVQLRVRDTGSGISAEQIRHIFERFHRVEGTPARTLEGTGIGLAFVSELVKLHGGKVDVESVYDQGSTFIVTLPKGRKHLPPDQIGRGRTLVSTALQASHYYVLKGDTDELAVALRQVIQGEIYLSSLVQDKMSGMSGDG
jgi:hypothetical protein